MSLAAKLVGTEENVKVTSVFSPALSVPLAAVTATDGPKVLIAIAELEPPPPLFPAASV